jgi:hypothetical protein
MHGNVMDAVVSSDTLWSFARRGYIPICLKGAQRRWACATVRHVRAGRTIEGNRAKRLHDTLIGTTRTMLGSLMWRMLLGYRIKTSIRVASRRSPQTRGIYTFDQSERC